MIVATQGRSFWVMDDVTLLYQLTGIPTSASKWLYDSAPAWHVDGSVNLRYWFKEAPDSSITSLEILEMDDTLIKRFSAEDGDLPIRAGMNEFSWNLRYEDAETFEGLIMWAGTIQGPRAIPGSYRTRLIVGEDSLETEFEILKDPRSTSTMDDLQAQITFLLEIRDKLTETHEAIKSIRSVRDQIHGIISSLGEEHEEIKQFAEDLIQRMTTIEETIYQTKNQSRQDPLNFPIRLNSKLAGVATNASIGAFRPTDQAIEVRDTLVQQIDQELSDLDMMMKTDVTILNEMVRNANIPAVHIHSNNWFYHHLYGIDQLRFFHL